MRSNETESPRIGLLWRGDPTAPPPEPKDTRLKRVFEELVLLNAHPVPVVYAEEAAERVRAQLVQVDGVLVWVDPIVGGRERASLDKILREVAAQGVFVSTHPDVTLKMGTKEVLYRTRSMPWGSDTHVYRSTVELRERFLETLRSSGVRVIKQDRGSAGNGVWRAELLSDVSVGVDAVIRVQPAQRGAAAQDLRFGQFVDEREPYFQAFGGTGCFVDQPYAERLAEGMVRCYMVQDMVAGFGHQLVTALLPAAPGEAAPDPPPRVYYGPSMPEFQRLRGLLDDAWIADMQQRLGIDFDSLPVIWDADFLLGPKDEAGADTYMLCEVNVSGVWPIPDECVAPLAKVVVQHTTFARRRDD